MSEHGMRSWNDGVDYPTPQTISQCICGYVSIGPMKKHECAGEHPSEKYKRKIADLEARLKVLDIADIGPEIDKFRAQIAAEQRARNDAEVRFARSQEEVMRLRMRIEELEGR